METDGRKLLFDCGAGTMRRLLEVGTKIFDISFIFFSHLHPDHTGELVPFLFATKYPDIERRQKPITIIAGKGFAGFYDRLKIAYGEWIELKPGLLNVVEMDNKGKDSLDFGDFIVESGDTDFSENLVVLAKNADLLICESALPDELKIAGHLTPSLAGEIATQANVRKLVLTHFYPECDQVDIEKQCRKTWSGPLILAEDLMKITIDA
jgi:ribonuclease BN (tRNA processing enzyme)